MNFSSLISHDLLKWDNSYIGEIDDSIVKPKKNNKHGFARLITKYNDQEIITHIVIETYTNTTYYIEMLKYIFGMKSKQKHICLYKKKYHCFFKYEGEYVLSSKETSQIPADEIAFLWIIGIKAKFWITKEGIVFTSKYSEIDHVKNKLTKILEKRLLENKHDITKIISKYKDEDILDKIFRVFTTSDTTDPRYFKIKSKIFSL